MAINGDILDSKEAAQLLNLRNSKCVERLARMGDIPACKIGKRWFYSKSALEGLVSSGGAR